MASGDYRKKLKCPPKNPCVVIRNLVELMEHPISQNATERHLLMLNEFLNASHYAFWLQDIPFVIRLYECIIKKIDDIPQYNQPLECLLYFSAIPPMLTKNSDKVDYVRDFQEYFSVLGYLILCLHSDDLKILVLNAIKNLLRPKPPIGFCCVPVEYCKDTVEKSKLPEIVAQLLQVIDNQIYPLLLDVMFTLCEISPKICEKMVRENAIEYLLQRLEPTWNTRYKEVKPKNPSSKDDIPTIEDTCCILWKLLNVIDREKQNVQNPSTFALWSLQYAFRWSNVCPGQRFNRNNLTAIILKIMTTFPTMEFIESDLGEDIAVLAMTAAGCGCHSRLEFTEDNLDFQFKKIIWASLHFFQQYESAEVIKKAELVKAFTKCLFQDHPKNKNHTEQYCEVTKIILKVIPTFLPCSIDMFINLDGPTRFLNMVEGYLTKTYETEVLECYMFCINEMLVQESNAILSLIGESGGYDVITSVCDKILENKSLTKVYQKIIAYSFSSLEILLTADYRTNSQAIKLCLKYLTRVVHPNESDPFLDVRVTICALYLLWECLKISGSDYHNFFKNGGIYVLLDITELCAFPAKVLSLGILADTAKKSACIPYLITWRKNGRQLLPMLMEVFRNKSKKVCESIETVKNQANTWLALCEGPRISFQANCLLNSDLVKSCRYKIHAILYALKVQFRERVETANEHYKLFNGKLNTDDELTMLFAENFFSLNLCQSWFTVFKELQSEGITPVEADNEYLIEKIERIRQWKQYIQDKIVRIIQKESQKEKYKELETYTTLKDARLSDALDGLKELRYISNCTERMFQMRKRLRLQQETEVTYSKNTNYHRTICDGPFTNIYNQSISIQSNVIFDKKEDQSPPTPVSLEDNQRFDDSLSDHNLSEYQLEC